MSRPATLLTAGLVPALALLAGLALSPVASAQSTTEAAPAEAAEGTAADETSEEEGPAPPPGPAAVMQGLDKITARISTFYAPMNEGVRFGSLEIVARTCHKTPPEEPPESTAYLEIVDVRPDAPSVPVFTGWMFASSPAVSALEHPVYDVWVVDCKKASNSASETTSGN